MDMTTANRLATSLSPYLQQHASNPVDWYPWCDEAFQTALSQDKPIFLSIGYSACHWCHVMAHESFENHEVARLMNDAFINIKVDREELPHIDHIYMQVCRLMNGSGGWPLTVIMTPDKKPFFAATYLPEDSRRGLMGMRNLVPAIKDLWATKRDKVLNAAEEIVRTAREYHTRSLHDEVNSLWLQNAFETKR